MINHEGTMPEEITRVITADTYNPSETISFSHEPMSKQPSLVYSPDAVLKGIYRGTETIALPPRFIYGKRTGDTEKEEIERTTCGDIWSLTRTGENGHTDDQGGVTLDETGQIKGFAVADGVGQTLAPQFAARAAVAESLHQIESGEFNSKFIKNVESALTEKYGAQKIRADIESATKNGMETEGSENITRQEATRLLSKEKPELVASTTLIAGTVDREKGLLKMALAGDGGFVVLTKDGNVKAAEGYFFETGAPPQIGIPVSDIDSLTILNSNLSVKKGDIVLIFTDGLLKGQYKYPQSIASSVSKLIRQKQVGEQTLNEISNELIDKAKNNKGRWPDDGTLLIFRV